MITKTRNRATATVELLFLLPVILLIVIALMYAGHLTLYRGRAHYGSEYAMNTEGNQSEQGAVRGTVSDLLYPSLVGELTLDEVPADSPDVPEPGELSEMFDEMSKPIYSTYAVGRYVFGSDGQLRFEVSTHQSQRLSKDGQYVANHGLRDNNIPELCTDELQGWISRQRVDVIYAYDPPYIHVGSLPLDAIQVETRHQSVVREQTSREVTDPPAGMNHQVDAVTGSPNMSQSGQLPHYPDFGGDEPFWEPN